MQTLSEQDWNFDNMPDDELVACCYWKHARESAFIRGLRQRCVENWRSGGCRDQKLHEDLQRAQSIGYSPEVFLRGFFFEPDIKYQSEDKELPNYRHPNAPHITGNFPQPWQSPFMEERKDRSHIKNDIITSGLHHPPLSQRGGLQFTAATPGQPPPQPLQPRVSG